MPRWFSELALVLTLAVTLLAEGAEAHAILISSTPAINAAVPGPEVEFTLRFNSRIDHKRSRLIVIAADKSQRVMPIESSGVENVLATEGSFKPGFYKLRWQVLAVDGHITRGDVPFTVGKN